MQDIAGIFGAGHVKYASQRRDYVSKLRDEIVKTDNHEWKKSLHVEEDTLKSVVEKLMATSAA
jgi:hypothetical protein